MSFALPLAPQALLQADPGFAALPAQSRQLTGTRSSPSATTTIPATQLPLPLTARLDKLTIRVDRPQLAKAEIAKLEAAMKAKASRE